jgi:hypothetical protein
MHLNFDLLHKNSHFRDKMPPDSIHVEWQTQIFAQNVVKLSSYK